MSLIKVPIFSGLVTNNDPEDLRADLTPDTQNFDISQSGVLKRRDASQLVSQEDDRGVNSAYLWSNNKLPNEYEWIAYCKQRGIIYRKSYLWVSIPTDSYDGLMAQFDSSHAPQVNTNEPFSTYLKILPDPLPDSVTFTAIGNLLFVNTGATHSPYIIYRKKDEKHFGELITVDDATYIEPYFRDYPKTFTTSVATNTTGGTLANGVYQYNVAPIYDGVNEYPLSTDNISSITLANSSNQRNVLTIGLNKNEYFRSLTGLNVYRSYAENGTATPTSFRRIKRININGKVGTNDQVVSVSNAKTSKYITYSTNGFPTEAELEARWNSAFDSTWSSLNNIFYGLHKTITEEEYNTLQSGDSSSVLTYTDPDTKIVYYADLASTDFYSSKRQNGSDISNFTVVGEWDDYFLDSNNRMLSNPVTEAYSENHEDKNFFEASGDTVLLKVVQVIGGVQGASLIYPITGCFMGSDKIYSPSVDAFSLNNNYSGIDLDINYTDNNGSSQTANEQILIHDARCIQVAIPTGGLSADMNAMSYRDAGNGNNSSTNAIAPRDVSFSTINNLSYAVSNDAITITYQDKGDSTGSLPLVAMGSNIDLEWKHSIPHGGRMFVANVLLDPKDAREEHGDMICFSEVGQPAIIPIVNFIQIKDPQGGDITGMQSLGDSLVVLMENGTYRLKVPSVDPRTYSIMESHEQIGCIASDSVVKVEDVIYFCGRGNIYKIDGSFLIDEIGDPILDTYLKVDSKDKSIARFDPIKEVIVFRLGTTQKILYEYNIRSGLWNKIKTYGSVSHIEQGYNGDLYYFDNTQLTVTREDGANLAEDSDVTIDETTDLGESSTVFTATDTLVENLADDQESWGNDNQGGYGQINSGYYFLDKSDIGGSNNGYWVNQEYVPMRIVSDNILKSDGSRVVVGELLILERTGLDDGKYNWIDIYDADDNTTSLNFPSMRKVFIEIPFAQMGELKLENDAYYQVGDFESWEDAYGNINTDDSKIVIFRANTSTTQAKQVTSDSLSSYDVSYYIRYDDILAMRRWTDIYSDTPSEESGSDGIYVGGTDSYSTPLITAVNSSADVTSDGSNTHIPYWGKIHTPSNAEIASLWDTSASGNPTKRAGEYLGIMYHTREDSVRPYTMEYQVWAIYYPDGNDSGHSTGIWRPLKDSANVYSNSLSYTYFYRVLKKGGVVINGELANGGTQLSTLTYPAYNPLSSNAIMLREIPISDLDDVTFYTGNILPTRGYSEYTEQ